MWSSLSSELVVRRLTYTENNDRPKFLFVTKYMSLHSRKISPGQSDGSNLYDMSQSDGFLLPYDDNKQSNDMERLVRLPKTIKHFSNEKRVRSFQCAVSAFYFMSMEKRMSLAGLSN